MKEKKDKKTKKVVKEEKQNKFIEIIKKKWLVDGSKTFLLVAIIIAIFIGVNILMQKLELTPIDFSQEKLYTLTDESKEKVKNIEKDVKIYFVGYSDDDSNLDLAKQYKKEENPHRHHGHIGSDIQKPGFVGGIPIQAGRHRHAPGPQRPQNPGGVNELFHFRSKIIGFEVISGHKIADISTQHLQIQPIHHTADHLPHLSAVEHGQKESKDKIEQQKILQIPPAGPFDKEPQDGSDEIQAHDHIDKPQMIMAKGDVGDDLPQGVGSAGPAVEQGSIQGIEGGPDQKSGGNAGQILAENAFIGHIPLRVQKEHAAEHDKHRHTPTYQAVKPVEDLPFCAAHIHSRPVVPTHMNHDHRNHGQSPQKVGIQQPTRGIFFHSLFPFVWNSTSIAYLPPEENRPFYSLMAVFPQKFCFL